MSSGWERTPKKKKKKKSKKGKNRKRCTKFDLEASSEEYIEQQFRSVLHEKDLYDAPKLVVSPSQKLFRDKTSQKEAFLNLEN